MGTLEYVCMTFLMKEWDIHSFKAGDGLTYNKQVNRSFTDKVQYYEQRLIQSKLKGMLQPGRTTHEGFAEIVHPDYPMIIKTQLNLTED